MRPYRVDDPNESLRACIASVFERPLHHIPHFEMASENPTWLQQLNDWTREKYSCSWAAAFVVVDDAGDPIQNALWTPPGWYIEAAEGDDGALVVFQVCSGGVTMHRPFAVTGKKLTPKCRLWMVVVDPARAWEHR